MIKLNIGSGDKQVEGFEGVDKMDYGQKYVFNIESYSDWYLNFPDDSCVDEIYTSHFLEHVRDINLVMFEIWRVLKPNATVTIIVPYYRCESAFRDPSHVRFFTEHTFRYFNKEHAKRMNYDMGYDYSFELVDYDLPGRELKCVLKAKK